MNGAQRTRARIVESVRMYFIRMAFFLSKAASFDKSGSEAATQWKGAENRDGLGLALGQFQGTGQAGIAFGALDFNVEHIGLRLAGHGAGDDACQGDFLSRKRAEEFVEATALVQQGGNECRA